VTHPRKCGESDWTDFIDSSLQVPIIDFGGLFPEYDAGFDMELGISTTVTLSALDELSDWTDFIDSSLQAPIVIVDGLFPEYDAGFDIELGISTTVTLSALNESSIRMMLRTSCCMS